MAIEFENLTSKEPVFFIKDKDTGFGIGLTKEDCYGIYLALKKMFPEIKPPENVKTS